VLGAPTFDGKRAVSPGFQQEIDGIIDELIAAFDVSVRHLPPDERHGWTARVVQSLGLPLHPPQIDLFGGDHRAGE